MRVLGRASEEVIRVFDDELIQRRAGGDQQRQRRAQAPAGAARALPGGGDGAGIAGHHDDVQSADVNAQLQRVGRHHAANRALAQAALDLAPLLRQISAAIAAHRVGQGRRPRAGVLQIGHQNFGRQPAVGEHQRLLPARDQLGGDAPGFVQVASGGYPVAGSRPADCRRRSIFRRMARRCAPPGGTPHPPGARPAPGVGDGRRAADELGVRTVKRARSASTAAARSRSGCRRRRGTSAARR